MKGLRRPKAAHEAHPKGLRNTRLAPPKPAPEARPEADKTTVPATYEQLSKAAQG